LFAGQMEAMARTGSGMISTLKDNIVLAAKEAGMHALPALKGALGDVLAEIQSLRASGELDEWGERTGEAIERTYMATKSLVTFVTEHHKLIAGMGFSYVAARTTLALFARVVMLRGALAQYRSAQLQAAAATSANTAAMGRQAAAASLSQIQMQTAGIQRASVATRGMALEMGAATRSSMSLDKVLGSFAAVGATAFVGWQIGKAIGETTELDDRLLDVGSHLAKILGMSDRTWGETKEARAQDKNVHEGGDNTEWAKAKARNEWMRRNGKRGGVDEKGRTFESAYATMFRGGERKSGGEDANAAQARVAGEARAKAREIGRARAFAAEDADIAAFHTAWEKLQRAAIRDFRAGDKDSAAVERFRRMTGGQDPRALSAFELADTAIAAKDVGGGSAEFGLEIIVRRGELRAAAEREASDKERKERERIGNDAERAKNRLAQMSREAVLRRARQAADAVQSATRIQVAALRERAAKERSEAERLRGRAQGRWAELLAPTSRKERRREEREERNEKRTKDRMVRVATSKVERGLRLTDRDKEVLRALRDESRATKLDARAKSDKRESVGAERDGEKAERTARAAEIREHTKRLTVERRALQAVVDAARRLGAKDTKDRRDEGDGKPGRSRPDAKPAAAPAATPPEHQDVQPTAAPDQSRSIVTGQSATGKQPTAGPDQARSIVTEQSATGKQPTAGPDQARSIVTRKRPHEKSLGLDSRGLGIELPKRLGLHSLEGRGNRQDGADRRIRSESPSRPGNGRDDAVLQLVARSMKQLVSVAERVESRMRAESEG